MRYLLLINASESQFETLAEAEQKSLLAEYGSLAQALAQAGVLLAYGRLRPVASATTVRVREGKTITSDGPFMEMKEQLAGFFLIDVAHLDDALGWAARIPSARTGGIEVRPIWERSA